MNKIYGIMKVVIFLLGVAYLCLDKLPQVSNNDIFGVIIIMWVGLTGDLEKK